MARKVPVAVEPVALTAKEIAVINKIIVESNDGADGTLGSTAWVDVVIGGKSREAVLGSLEEKGVIEVEDSEGNGKSEDLFIKFLPTAHPIIQKAVDAGQLPDSIFGSSDEDEEDEDEEDEDEEDESAPAPVKKGKTVATAPAAVATAKTKITRGAPAVASAPAAKATKTKTNGASPVSAAPEGETFPQKMARLKAEKAARIASGEEEAPVRAAKAPKVAKVRGVTGTPTARLGYTETDPRYIAVHQLAGLSRKVRRAQVAFRRGVSGATEANVEAAHTALVDFINANEEILELTE